MSLGDHTIESTDFGGYLVALRGAELVPAWIEVLRPGFNRYFVAVLPDDTIVVLASEPTVGDPRFVLAFYRPR